MLLLFAAMLTVSSLPYRILVPSRLRVFNDDILSAVSSR